MIKKPILVIDLRMIRMSGIGTYLQNILPYVIDSKEFEVLGIGDSQLETFPWFNKIKFIPMKSPVLGMKEQFEFLKIIPSCNLFWAPNWNAPLLPNKAPKMVTTIHDINHIVNPNQFGRLKYLLAKMMVSACIHKANSIITVSQFSKSELLRVFPSALNKIEAFPLAVSSDFNVFTPLKWETKNYLLAVGNVKPHKNLKQALEVFEQLPISDLKFVIVGKRDGFKTGYGIQLEPIIAKLGERVIFTGEVDKNELLNYYANARGFVFPSLYEGFGLPLLEAMKFNLPILASNKASIPEVLSPKALFFDPNMEGDFFEKMQLFLATYPNGSTIDYSDHLAKFSWEKTANQHIDLFHKILRN